MEMEAFPPFPLVTSSFPSASSQLFPERLPSLLVPGASVIPYPASAVFYFIPLMGAVLSIAADTPTASM
jgi:hypothetical protein